MTMDIREAIRNIAGAPAPTVVVGTVTATDGATADIQPLDQTAAPLLGIDLSVGETAALSYHPEVGAVVLVVLDTPTSGFVIGASRGKIVMNGGELGALIKIDELRAQLDKMTARIDGIIDAIKNGKPAPQDGGAGLQTTIISALAKLNDKEDFGDIADNNITH